ncbi:hypothetical protein POVCU1_050030 [Plasmodium ovale curtisi]|uniref:Uncharacterized protein n=1 Tax=Plasmodium ovale curtisi TaxID=864141 RepID=A0A1A8X181_PLAOA|nr:hypothetical protein POVCU1_050030 [Plasmodium ovale curtisi]
MMQGFEQCKQLIGSSQFTSMLIGDIRNLCKCFDTNAQQEDEKCDCTGITENNSLNTAIKSFKECHGNNTDLQSSMANSFRYLSEPCYRKSLREILNSLDKEKICEVDISPLKEKGEKMLTVMDTVGGTVSGALQLVEKIKGIFYNGKSFFGKLIEKFPGYTMLYPVGVLVFILMVVIGILYSIFKLFRCIFCPPPKESNVNHNEQMKYLQEQYNRTLQTNAQLNNFLIGYQNA